MSEEFEVRLASVELAFMELAAQLSLQVLEGARKSIVDRIPTAVDQNEVVVRYGAAGLLRDAGLRFGEFE